MQGNWKVVFSFSDCDSVVFQVWDFGLCNQKKKGQVVALVTLPRSRTPHEVMDTMEVTTFIWAKVTSESGHSLLTFLWLLLKGRERVPEKVKR